MPFTKIVYRPVIGGDEPQQEYPQTADQAAQAIGINLLVGFRVEREESKSEDGMPLTTVSIYGMHEDTEDVLFGVYEFHGRM
ncbi:hypothetical protein [Streptomyces sp. NPDC010273]|uniref:hypothetical protein n=1 Tax=Streptomyces sp. NPDC010273 TaxID=3364829 RepID=UPI0036EF6ECA